MKITLVHIDNQQYKTLQIIIKWLKNSKLEETDKPTFCQIA